MVDQTLSFEALDGALSRCMAAHPPEGVERRLHPDANSMSGLWAQMVVNQVESVPLADVGAGTLEALSRWGGQDTGG